MNLRLVTAAALAALLVLPGCGSNFATSFDAPVAAEVSAGWRLADVVVRVPPSLEVSEARTLFPQADIVWREDPPGDRRAQVGRIIADAARAGAAGLSGSRPVVIDVTVSRFHALTFEAEARLTRSGVHDLEFTATVKDAASGAVLAGPTFIEASLPALSGAQMVEARARGETQKIQISAHLRRVFAGWLGLGPDPRQSFNRLGG